MLKRDSRAQSPGSAPKGDQATPSGNPIWIDAGFEKLRAATEAASRRRDSAVPTMPLDLWRRWAALERERFALNQAASDATDYLDSLGAPGERTPQQDEERSRIRVLLTGAKLAEHDRIHRLRQIAREGGILDAVSDYLDLVDYREAGEVTVRLGDLSLADLGDPGCARKHALGAIYRALALTSRAVHDELRGFPPADLVAGNAALPADIAPELTEEWLREAVSGVFLSLYISESQLTLASATAASLPREALETARRLMANVRSLRGLIFEALCDPAAPGFAELAAAILEPALSGGPEAWSDVESSGLGALDFACIADRDHLARLFRLARRMSRDGVQPAFYERVVEAIETEIAPRYQGSLQTAEDAQALGDAGGWDGSIAPPSDDDLRRIAGQILHARQFTYEVDPAAMIWRGLVPPAHAYLGFDRNQPARKFTVTLHYENDLGEVADLTAGYDLRPGKTPLTWSVLNEPTDPAVQPIAVAITIAARAMLETIRDESLARKKERDEQVAARDRVVAPTSARKLPGSRVLSREAYDAATAPSRSEPIPDVAALLAGLGEQRERAVTPRLLIAVPEPAALGDLLGREFRGLDALFLDAMRDLNTLHAAGHTTRRFKSLAVARGSRNVCYELKVFPPDLPGGARIILQKGGGVLVPRSIEKRRSAFTRQHADRLRRDT